MAKHHSKKSVRFQIEFRPSEQGAANGGQLAVHTLLEQFGLWKKIKGARGLEVRTHKGKGYDPEVYAGQVLFCVATGGVSVADAERLDHDASIKDILGVEKFADQTALAYNALMALKLIHLPESEQPRQVRTLIRHLLLIPVELTRHARQIKAAFSQNKRLKTL